MNEWEKSVASAAGNPDREEQSGHWQQDFTEDQAIAELQRADISATDIALLAKSPAAAKSQKVALAMVLHPRAPRLFSIPMLRRMFTFDLMQVSLTPAVAPDIKRAAEDQILVRAEALSTGEKISLAKRASGRVAAALLQEDDERVISPALDNPHLTEILVVQTLMKPRAPKVLFVLSSEHRKWSQRREIQMALLRSEKTPVEKAKELAKNFPEGFLREIVPGGRLFSSGDS
jgi:hypothetical protein